MNPRETIFALLLALGLLLPATAQAQEQPGWEAVERILGREGELDEGVFGITIPRSDVDLRIEGTPVSPELAAKAWVGFWPHEGDGSVQLMGDVAMPASNVAAAQRALYRQGLKMTALHNHLVGEEPRMMFMHISGTAGSAETLARKARAVLEAADAPLEESEEKESEEKEEARGADGSAVRRVLGTPDEREGDVAEYTFARADLLTVKGRTLPITEGLETKTEATFQVLGDGKAAAVGEFFLRAQEVDPVARVLREHGFTIMALHTHMLWIRPRMFWMHFWKTGAPGELARGVRAALAEMNLRPGALPQ